MNRGAPRIEIQTTIGPFVVELYTDHAPKTCKNFIELTRKGYYNNTPFHRVIRVGFASLLPLSIILMVCAVTLYSNTCPFFPPRFAA